MFSFFPFFFFFFTACFFLSFHSFKLMYHTRVFQQNLCTYSRRSNFPGYIVQSITDRQCTILSVSFFFSPLTFAVSSMRNIFLQHFWNFVNTKMLLFLGSTFFFFLVGRHFFGFGIRINCEKNVKRGFLTGFQSTWIPIFFNIREI